jgi:hypothetical protein
MAKKKISPEDIVQRNPDMVASKLDDEYVMMSVENGEYYGLDETGSRIWDLIEDEIEVNDLVGKLMKKYDVDKEICENDVLEFLQELYNKKLVVKK